METSLPKKIPDKKTFVIKLLNAIFPELLEGSKKPSAGDYKAACRNAIKELELADKYTTSGSFTEFPDFNANAEDLYSVIFELNEFDKKMNGHDNFAPEHGTFEKRMVDYSNCIFNLMSSSAKTLNSLISGESQKLYKKFETATFLTWLLLKRRECEKEAAEFLSYCLNVTGIQDTLQELKISESIHLTGSSFDSVEKEQYGITYKSITDKGARLLLYSIFLVFDLLGHYPQKGGEDIQKFYRTVSEIVSEDIEVSGDFEAVREKLINDLSTFEPRSVSRPGQYFLEDFYVLPVFEKDKEKCPPPLWDLANVTAGMRGILTGKTGYGKTMYIRMLAKRILEEQPDVTVLFITARDFAACFNNKRYREHTIDLAELFFFKMLSQTDTRKEDEVFTFSERHREYLYGQAKAGRLILLADSYDELPPGETREAFLRGLLTFCEEYCVFLEKKSVGAHVLLASRQMTAKVMQEVTYALKPDEAEGSDHIYTIKGLDDEGKKQLVKNWMKYGSEEDHTDELFSMINTNHYFTEAAQSPYTLTLICSYFGSSFGTITEKYLGWIERKLRARIREIEDPVVKKALSDDLDIIRSLALESLKAGKKEFDRHAMDKVISEFIKEHAPEEDPVKKIGNIREILIMQSGVIVPAEGEDELFTFTDDHIRYSLVSDKLRETLFEERGYEKMQAEVFEGLDVRDRVNVTVRLICGVGMAYAAIINQLAWGMLTVMTRSGDEEEQLVTGLEDIILNRYKQNLISAASLGTEQKDIIEPLQRLIVMRILCSPKFKPGKKEPEMFKRSAVFRKISEFIGKG